MHNGVCRSTPAPTMAASRSKMSKSLGNVVTIQQFLREHTADVLRLIVLSGYYRGPLLYGSRIVADQARNGAAAGALEPAHGSAAAGPLAETAAGTASATRAQFVAAMDDDFNTAAAMACDLRAGARDQHCPRRQRWREPFAAAQATLRELAGVLGLTLAAPKPAEQAAAPFIGLIELRAELRKAKQFAL
ncbi:MAG: DALR domain-containing protein [Kouleothrix sp.]